MVTRRSTRSGIKFDFRSLVLPANYSDTSSKMWTTVSHVDFCLTRQTHTWRAAAALRKMEMAQRVEPRRMRNKAELRLADI